MYFHYPTWHGSMPDPSLVPPPPVVFKPCYFKPEKSTAKHDNDQYTDSYTAGDGPEYVRPMPYPPPPKPPKKEDYFDYWAYTRVYNSRPYSFGHAHEYPPFPRSRPYGYASSAYDYRYTHSHSHMHPHPHPHQHPQPPHSKHSRTSWSTQDATKAWRAKQRRLWEEWERAGNAWQSHEYSGWEDQAQQPSSNPRPSESSNGGWREGWRPPRSPSPARSDSGWHGREWGQEADRGTKQGFWDYWEHSEDWEVPFSNVPHRPNSSPPSETRLPEAFALYCKIWETLLSPDDSKRLMFRNIPWPQYPSPRSVQDIDVQNVRAFLMAGGRPLKVCHTCY